MKKIIIFGYFIFVFLFSFFIVKATIHYKMDNITINYVHDKINLSDDDLNKHGIIPKENKTYYKKVIFRQTRTKNNFGWDTKIDTITDNLVYYN